MIHRRSRRLGAALGAAVAATLLAACGGLGSSSSVRPGLRVDQAPPPPGRVVYPGPAQGSSPEQIVRGFLSAGATSDGDYANAREFLSVVRQSWVADAGVTVYDSASPISVRIFGNSVNIQARGLARIDDSGHYRQLPPRTVVTAAMQVDQEGGEWRISELPDNFGRWLSSSDLDRLFRPYSIYYLSRQSRRLVPDVRWLALDRLATRLTRALLLPVPAYLDGAVTSAIPKGTSLTVDAVPVGNGVASVDISAAQIVSDPVARSNMWGQFVATLTQAPEVQRVRLTVEGADLVPGRAQAPGSLADLNFPDVVQPPEAKPLLRSESRLLAVDERSLIDPSNGGTSATATKYPALGAGWVGIAQSRTGLEVAAVSANRSDLSRWRGAEQFHVPYFALRLGKPSYDNSDVLWIGGVGTGRNIGNRLWTVNVAADPHDAARSAATPVVADWLRSRLILSARVSDDGQRIAVTSTDDHGADPRVDVAGVIRAPNGIPQKLSVPFRVGGTLIVARDATWLDATTLAVLGRVGPKETVRPYVVPLGGPMDPLTAVAGAAALTTTGGPRGIVVTTSSGSVMVRAGSGWVKAGEGTDFAVAGV